MLRKCFSGDPKWSNETVMYVSRTTGLNVSQVYKWGWDQKKKTGDLDGFDIPTTDEFGGYSKHGFTNLDSICRSIGLNIDEKLKMIQITPPSKKSKKEVIPNNMGLKRVIQKLP